MAQIFNNFWKKYAKPEVKKQWRAKFYQKFESALVTRIDQEDILFNAGIGGEGVCNAMVTDWFARIQKGEKPWETPDPTYYEREIVRLARAQGVLPKEESLDEFVMVEGDQDSAPKKKGDSLEDFEVIEHDKKGKKKPAKDDLDEEDFEVVEHDNKGKPKKDRDSLDEEDFEPVSKDPGDRKEEHETEPESGEVEFEKFTQGHAQDIASKVYQAVESARNPAVFFRLHLRGFYRGRPQGHQLAIYVRILGGDVGEEVPVPERDKLKKDTVLVKKAPLLSIHFMDPNAGEFQLDERRHGLAPFLWEWYTTFYPPLIFGFKQYSLSQDKLG